MLPVPPDVLNRLRLPEAIVAEASSWQSLLPAVPGIEALASNPAPLARWLGGQLRSGMPTSPHVLVSTRKAQHGVRPVPVWGFPERVAYRALVDFVLRNALPLDRSPEAYLTFIGGPLDYARELEPASSKFRSVGSAVIQYVVKADITAFYEYVDHSVLARELLARTGDYSAIECLMSLLAEVQGRTYGLPQLLDPSDRLSEVYIDLVEREVLRRGWPAWRFNDDFRIAVRDFGAALSAVEDLAAAARECGLTLNDMKTTTPRFSTYAMENFGLEIDDELPSELRRHEPEDFVGDYTEGVGESDPTWAVQLLARTSAPDTHGQPSANGLSLGSLRGDDIRQLRRALGRLIRAGIPDALEHVVRLIVYAAPLTPWAVRYVTAAGAQSPGNAAQVLRTVIEYVSLSDWQRAWVVRALDALGMLDGTRDGQSSATVEWVGALRHGRHGPLVVAEAALALAAVDAIGFADLEYALRSEPAALGPWYLAAIQRQRARGRVTDEEYGAVRREVAMYAALLPEAT